jgi:hypothetical protein
LIDPIEYRSIVGGLQYCTLTRPDISFLINQLCQFIHSPTDKHWTAGKRVLRYLKVTIDHGLHYSKSSLQLNAYYDLDRTGSPNDQRFTSGFKVFLGAQRNNILLAVIEYLLHYQRWRFT